MIVCTFSTAEDFMDGPFSAEEPVNFGFDRFGFGIR